MILSGVFGTMYIAFQKTSKNQIKNMVSDPSRAYQTPQELQYNSGNKLRGSLDV